MNQKILGSLKINPVAWFINIAMLLTPFYTYYMAVSKGEVKPFPHVTITDTATHYPQDIVFSSSFLALSFYISSRWIQMQAERVGYPIPSKILFYIAQASLLCYGITIGTIDQGGQGKLHGPCAVIFFVTQFSSLINTTFLLTKMREWDTSVITKQSLRLKQILAGYSLALWTWCIYHMVTESRQGPNKQDIYVVIIQWNSTIANLLWVLTCCIDWRGLKLCLVKSK